MPDDMEQWPIGRLLSTASRQVENAWQEALAAHGLSHAGAIVLHLLVDGPLSQSQLAASAKVEDQTMSRTIERLERSGLVSRERDPADGRRMRVSITDAGASVFRATRTIEADVFPDIAEPELLRAQLTQIIRSSRRWTGPGEPRPSRASARGAPEATAVQGAPEVGAAGPA